MRFVDVEKIRIVHFKAELLGCSGSELVNHLDSLRHGISQAHHKVSPNLAPGLQLPILSVPGFVVVTVLPIIVGTGAVVIVIIVSLFLQ